jgi:DNA-binding GntR family transcriptional regulator
MEEMKNVSVDLNPLQRPKSLNDMAYQSLKGGILAGKLTAGEIYSELELARQFGISRTPVREALLRLSAENLIVFHPRKGMSINYFNKEDIENLFELRKAIEEATISKMAMNLSEEQIQAAKGIIAEQENCIKNDYNETLFLELDRKLHLLFIEASRNRFVVQTYNSIRDYMTISAKKGLARKGRAHEVVREHKAIVEALSKRNGKRIKEAINRHLVNSKLAALGSHIENLQKWPEGRMAHTKARSRIHRHG